MFSKFTLNRVPIFSSVIFIELFYILVTGSSSLKKGVDLLSYVHDLHVNL